MKLAEAVSIKDFGHTDSIFFAHSSNETIRFRASSGGFTKSFLVYLLESHVVDFAIVTRTGGPDNPLVPETTITSSKQDILSTRTNSVYAVNNPFVVLKEISDNKKYAFVGLPCHVRHLRALQKQGKYRNVVVVIGLFCNHTPKMEFTRDILRRLNVRESDVAQIEYRGGGWPGGFTAHLKDGQAKFLVLQRYWDNDLSNGPTVCNRCSEIAEDADIYAGDAWNLRLERTDSKGTTLVICRNKQASRLVRRAAEAGHIKIDKCSQEQLVQSQGYHIGGKLRRKPGQSSDVKTADYSHLLRRVLNLAVHPLLAYRVAMNILRAILNKSKRMISKCLERGKAALDDWQRLIKLLREPDHYTLTHVACGAPVIRRLLRRAFANRVLIWYWREERRQINFGDYITEVLVKEFGYKTVNYHNASLLNILPTYRFCLLVIGSELHKGMMDSLRVPELYIWGQGKGHGEYFDIRSEPYAAKVKIFAVRGPHTVRQLHLDERTPVGDPALLMPLFFPVRRDASQHRITYIPHWSNRAGWDINKEKLGAQRFVDVMCSRREFWSKLREIVSSEFVLTNSFHTAVVCHAYRTPWALCLADGDELNFPDKWRDFFEFLGVGDGVTAVKNYEEGLEWWNEVGSKARRADSFPLLDSFPLPVTHKRILTIMNQMKSSRATVKD
jgi:coenzyme F420-reducing hydrogenase beta subunit